MTPFKQRLLGALHVMFGAFVVLFVPLAIVFSTNSAHLPSTSKSVSGSGGAIFDSRKAMGVVRALAEECRHMGSPEMWSHLLALQDSINDIVADPATLPEYKVEGIVVQDLSTPSFAGHGWYPSETTRGAVDIPVLTITVVGTEPSLPPVVLAGHIDSRSYTKGAGDDAISIAFQVEIVRSILKSRRMRRSVVMLVDTGEEMGLQGAYAWDPAAPPQLVLNVDSIGTEGPLQMSRASPAASWAVKLFAKEVPKPVGTSAMAALFSLIPSDTDFTAFTNRHIASIDFNFIHGGARYHTEADGYDFVREASVQHGGANLLAIIRAVADFPGDLPTPANPIAEEIVESAPPSAYSPSSSTRPFYLSFYGRSMFVVDDESTVAIVVAVSSALLLVGLAISAVVSYRKEGDTQKVRDSFHAAGLLLSSIFFASLFAGLVAFLGDLSHRGSLSAGAGVTASILVVCFAIIGGVALSAWRVQRRHFRRENATEEYHQQMDEEQNDDGSYGSFLIGSAGSSSRALPTSDLNTPLVPIHSGGRQKTLSRLGFGSAHLSLMLDDTDPVETATNSLWLAGMGLSCLISIAMTMIGMVSVIVYTWGLTMVIALGVGAEHLAYALCRWQHTTIRVERVIGRTFWGVSVVAACFSFGTALFDLFYIIVGCYACYGTYMPGAFPPLFAIVATWVLSLLLIPVAHIFPRLAGAAGAIRDAGFVSLFLAAFTAFCAAAFTFPFSPESPFRVHVFHTTIEKDVTPAGAPFIYTNLQMPDTILEGNSYLSLRLPTFTSYESLVVPSDVPFATYTTPAGMENYYYSTDIQVTEDGVCSSPVVSSLTSLGDGKWEAVVTVDPSVTSLGTLIHTAGDRETSEAPTGLSVVVTKPADDPADDPVVALSFSEADVREGYNYYFTTMLMARPPNRPDYTYTYTFSVKGGGVPDVYNMMMCAEAASEALEFGNDLPPWTSRMARDGPSWNINKVVEA